MKALIASLAAVAAVFPSAVFATEFFFNPAGDSGEFEAASSWYVDGLPQSETPGEDDEICCTNGPKLIRFSLPGVTHRVARVTLDKDNYTKDQLLDVDMNGGALYVTNVVAMRASRYQAGVARPSLGITNGTLHAVSGIECGRSDNNYRGAFEVVGPDSHVVISNGDFRVKGAGSLVNVGGGASLTWAGTGSLILDNGSSSAFQSESTIAQVNVTGAGTTISGNSGLYLTCNSRLRIADGAVASFSGYAITGKSGRQNRSSVGNVDNNESSNASLEIDGATFSITNGSYFMVAEHDRKQQMNHSLTVKNGGVFNFSGDTQFVLGWIASTDNGEYRSARQNYLRVYSGGRFSSDGNEVSGEWNDVGSIKVGGFGNCYDNGIHVSNGVVSVNHIALAGSNSASNNWLRIEGRSSRVLLNQKYAAPGNKATNWMNPALGMHNNARVEFVLGPDGFDNPPIEMTTELGTVYGQQKDEGMKARIVVEDCGFARNNVNTTITLIKTLNAADNREFLQQLAEDGVVLADRENQIGRLSVSKDGTSLLYTTPKKAGLSLFVR